MHIKNENNINLGIFFNKTIKKFIEKNKHENINRQNFSGGALKRICKELIQFDKLKLKNICAGPVDDNNLYHWNASILGPENTPYQRGVFFINIHFPCDYPFHSPRIRLLTKIFHPNISVEGSFCCCSMGFLYDQWSPALTITNILLIIYSLLADKDLKEDCGFGNSEAKDLYLNNRAEYETRAKEWTKKYAC